MRFSPPAFLANLSRRDLWFAALSVFCTSVVMIGFLVESRWGYMAPEPKIVYVENWGADRGVAEAKARQEAELAEQERLMAEAKARQREDQQAPAAATPPPAGRP